MCFPGSVSSHRLRTPKRAWDFDALGNWDSLTTDGGSPQTRTHNKQNEITSVSGATTPTYDANGNMTTDETGKQYVYDAWNRLKVAKNSGGTTLKTYVYDALNRRVAETASGATTDFYYSSGWQVLEKRDTARTNDTKVRYVWRPVYVDAMILRDRDTADDGTLDERLWVQQDANWNVTALTNSSGTVVDRYAYDPFGVVTIMNAGWTGIGSSAYAWQHLHQGGRLDATSGLYHFRNRDYSSMLGKWATRDPILYGGLDTNLTRAFAGSPLSQNDPSGLSVCFEYIELTDRGLSNMSNHAVTPQHFRELGMKIDPLGGPSYGFKITTSADVSAEDHIVNAKVKQEVKSMALIVNNDQTEKIYNTGNSTGGSVVIMAPGRANPWLEGWQDAVGQIIDGKTDGSAAAFLSDLVIDERVNGTKGMTTLPGGFITRETRLPNISVSRSRISWDDFPGWSTAGRNGLAPNTASTLVYMAYFRVTVTDKGGKDDGKSIVADFALSLFANSDGQNWTLDKSRSRLILKSTIGYIRNGVQVWTEKK